jgi:carbamoyl-phosphate synthase large subunit
MVENNAILIFGGSELQFSIIKKCKASNLFTVVIDPNPNAKGQEIADAFEVVDGQDYNGTCIVVEKYNIKSIITAATDKPLYMMARIASKYNFPFFSEETALVATDKHLMKTKFQQFKIPCANGKLVSSVDDSLEFPMIVKPRDNSGSRGVVFCNSIENAKIAILDALHFTKKDTVLIEEVINGNEYSIESLHFNGITKVIQITEKITTTFPYNVELGHIQPAQLEIETINKITALIELIAVALNFENCASHTELKINEKGIFIIETSPRLGGDNITSILTQLSTGVDIEQALIEIAIGNNPIIEFKDQKSSGIFYLNLQEGEVQKIINIDSIKTNKDVYDLKIMLETYSIIPKITNSLDRYGYFILNTSNRNKLMDLSKMINEQLKKRIIIKKNKI